MNWINKLVQVITKTQPLTTVKVKKITSDKQRKLVIRTCVEFYNQHMEHRGGPNLSIKEENNALSISGMPPYTFYLIYFLPAFRDSPKVYGLNYKTFYTVEIAEFEPLMRWMISFSEFYGGFHIKTTLRWDLEEFHYMKKVKIA